MFVSPSMLRILALGTGLTLSFSCSSPQDSKTQALGAGLTPENKPYEVTAVIPMSDGLKKDFNLLAMAYGIAQPIIPALYAVHGLDRDSFFLNVEGAMEVGDIIKGYGQLELIENNGYLAIQSNIIGEFSLGDEWRLQSLCNSSSYSCDIDYNADKQLVIKSVNVDYQFQSPVFFKARPAKFISENRIYEDQAAENPDLSLCKNYLAVKNQKFLSFTVCGQDINISSAGSLAFANEKVEQVIDLVCLKPASKSLNYLAVADGSIELSSATSQDKSLLVTTAQPEVDLNKARVGCFNENNNGLFEVKPELKDLLSTFLIL